MARALVACAEELESAADDGSLSCAVLDPARGSTPAAVLDLARGSAPAAVLDFARGSARAANLDPARAARLSGPTAQLPPPSSASSASTQPMKGSVLNRSPTSSP